MTGFSRNTIDKLLCDVGRNASIYQDRAFRSLTCKRSQCDEIWSFVGAKERNASEEQKAEGWGDVWTWVAMDADKDVATLSSILSRDKGKTFKKIKRGIWALNAVEEVAA